MLAIAVAGASVLVPLGTVVAGEVSFVSYAFSASRPVPHIHFEGPVLEGDLARLTDALTKFTSCDNGLPQIDVENCAVLTFKSPGGNYIEGLRMAHALRDAGVASWVVAGNYCYSACAFAFLGGSGYSPDTGGAFIDRTIEPGAVLGFHAPYFAADDLDTMIAEIGVDEVLGGTRDNIALMVQELVHWNVDKSVLAKIASMGADEAYEVETPLDLYLTRTALPDLPVAFWEPINEKALFNSCTRLLAYHNSDWPDVVVEAIQDPILYEIGTDEYGRSLSGYAVTHQPSGLTVSYCALPTAELGLDGDADISLYFGPGIEGHMRPAVSLFQRPMGWSSLGAGGAATQRILQKGSLNHVFIDIGANLESDFGLAWTVIRDSFFTEGYMP